MFSRSDDGLTLEKLFTVLVYIINCVDKTILSCFITCSHLIVRRGREEKDGNVILHKTAIKVTW